MRKQLRFGGMHNPFPRVLLVGAVLVAVFGNSVAQEAANDSRAPLRELNRALQELSEQVAPAVVQVFTTGIQVVPAESNQNPGTVAPRRMSGSGVLVDGKGYVITNAHIVLGAQKIVVLRIRPSEGAYVQGSVVRPFGNLQEARLVGFDLETDIAVLKIETRVLRYLAFGDSDDVRKGQLVFAFGSPRGWQDSLSMGVVSAVARQLRPNDPLVYIQTDASIRSSGNGGPLVDIEGRIIGVSNSQVNQFADTPGFGYAVPSNIVQAVYRQIRQFGHVRRGVIGALTQTIAPPMARPLNLPRERGVIIADVLPFSPADLAGLRPGDLVLTLDGKIMENARQFDVNVYQRGLGESVSLGILRGDSELTIEVPVVERSDDPSRFAKLVDPEKNFIPQLAILAIDVAGEVADVLPMLRAHEGVLVAALATGVPSVYDFQPGDVIRSINGKPIKSLGELRSDLGQRKKGDIIVLQVERRGLVRYATLAIE